MKKRILIISAVALLGVSSLAFNSFATNVTNQSNQGSQQKERPEKPKNQVFGKITAISENSVTISLAEMKKPENGQGGFDRNFDGQEGMQRSDRGQGKGNGGINGSNNNNNQNQPPERKELTEEQKAEMKKNFENMFTLTGETKTIDISSAKFNDFGRGPKDGKNNNSSSAANNENINKTEKTYKDYQVGDYISIELESETSNKATKVRDAWGMRGGMPRGDRGQGKGNGVNNSNNANN